MKPEVVTGRWFEVECSDGGTDMVPFELIGETDPKLDAFNDYVESEPVSFELKSGVGARFSASGFLDATPWSVYDTAVEAWTALIDEDASAFTWLTDENGAHIHMPSCDAAAAMVAAVQSLAGTMLERDGCLVYCLHIDDDSPLVTELKNQGFTVSE